MDFQRMTAMGRWLYAIACVVVPILWGLIVVWASNRIERAVERRLAHPDAPRREFPPIEYHI